MQVIEISSILTALEYLVNVYLTSYCVWMKDGGVHAITHTCKLEKSMVMLVLFFCLYVGSRDRTQDSRPHSSLLRLKRENENVVNAHLEVERKLSWYHNRNYFLFERKWRASSWERRCLKYEVRFPGTKNISLGRIEVPRQMFRNN